MGSNLFSSVVSGMNAAQLGMQTAQHNIVNAGTPGFSRQQVVTSARLAYPSGSGFVGQGVDISGVKRIYDQYLNAQVMQEQSQASYLSTYYNAMKQIDNLVADPAAGASPALQEFFSAMNGVANNPDSAPARQTLLSAAQFVVNRFQSIDQRMTDIATSVNGQISSSVDAINTFARQIAALNNNISVAAASYPNQPPNDLLDQRDQLINELNKEIRVNVIPQANGAVSVFIGTGQALVIDNQAMSLRAAPSSSDPTKIDISYINGISTIPLQQSNLQGGKLGGYLAFRDQSLEPARNALGRVAAGLADSVNQQHQLGQDLNGMLGGVFFNTGTPLVIRNANNGSAAAISASITDVSALTTSDYKLSYDGANYSIMRMSDNAVTSLGAALPDTVDGFTVSLASGAPVAGDTFLIRPVANAARNISLAINDTTKIAAAAPMRAMIDPGNTGTAKISSGTVKEPPPTDVNLQQPVIITFDNPPTTFSVSGVGTGNPTNVPYTPGDDISYNGWKVQITGTPATGDTFSVVSNTKGSGDNRNALLMAGLQTRNLLVNGTANLQGTYGQMVGEVGTKTHELSVVSLAQDNMLAQTVASQQAVSGVNLDEEAANLLQFQRAYQAAAKAMQIANTMFDTLLSSIR